MIEYLEYLYDDNNYYILMELVEEGSLYSQIIESINNNEKTMDNKSVRMIAK